MDFCKPITEPLTSLPPSFVARLGASRRWVGRTLQKGFTLIELIIVVAIIALLATLAYPAYEDYVIRSRVAEALAAGGPCKAAVSLAIQRKIPGGGRGNRFGCEGPDADSLPNLSLDADKYKMPDPARRLSRYVNAISTDDVGTIYIWLNVDEIAPGKSGPSQGFMGNEERKRKIWLKPHSTAAHIPGTNSWSTLIKKENYDLNGAVDAIKRWECGGDIEHKYLPSPCHFD